MNASSHENAVVVKNLEKRFGSFIAVNRVSFEVQKGEIFGFLGPNGAGKSTTIRMLTGILAPTGGTGTVAGFDVRTQAEKIKANIGYMSQKFSLYEDLTVEENIDFYSGIYRIPPEKKKERKEWVIEMAGLPAAASLSEPGPPKRRTRRYDQKTSHITSVEVSRASQTHQTPQALRAQSGPVTSTNQAEYDRQLRRGHRDAIGRGRRRPRRARTAPVRCAIPQTTAAMNSDIALGTW